MSIRDIYAPPSPANAPLRTVHISLIFSTLTPDASATIGFSPTALISIPILVWNTMNYITIDSMYAKYTTTFWQKIAEIIGTSSNTLICGASTFRTLPT